MGLRVSGKNALITITDPAAAEFDISGVDSDGRSRANDFSMEIAGNVVEAEGYGEDFVEPVPTGQTRVSGSLKVFYNSAADEVEDFLWEMYQAQHAPGTCTPVGAYSMTIMPEGNCTGKAQWDLSQVIIETLSTPMPVADIMYIEVAWKAWEAERSTISQGT